MEATCSLLRFRFKYEVVSVNFDNHCLDAISINSVFFTFRVSLLADTHCAGLK